MVCIDVSFYELYYLLGLDNPDEFTKKVIDDYVDTMYDVLRDYTLMASLIEARHTDRVDADIYALRNRYTTLFDIIDVIRYKDRYDAFDMLARKYIVVDENLLNQLICYFYDEYWEDGYGGDNWGYIVEKFKDALNYDSKLMFVDTVKYLNHNNGCYLDKGYMFSFYNGEAFYEFLDCTRDGTMYIPCVSDDFYLDFKDIMRGKDIKIVCAATYYSRRYEPLDIEWRYGKYGVKKKEKQEKEEEKE